jgi:predicted PurR-regulated permease PerM
VPPLLDGRLRLPARAGLDHGATVREPRGGSPPGPISWATIGRLLAAAFGAWVLIQTWQLWILLFTALIVAAAILPAARWGDRHRIPRVATVVGVYAGAAVVLGLLGRFLVPAIAEQGAQFVGQLPALVDNVRGWAESAVLWADEWGVPLPGLPTAGWEAIRWEDLKGVGQVLLQNTFRATAGVIGAVVGFFLVLVLAAYLVIDAERIAEGLQSLVPADRRERVGVIVPTVLGVMGAYVRGQIIVSLCVGVVIALGLTVLGVRYALLIGGVAAVLNAIPFLGSPVAAVLGILAALNVSATLAVWTALLFWGANLLEAKLLVPFFVGRATGLHPVAVLMAILAGAQLAGLVGALVAVPLLAGAWGVLRAASAEPGSPAAPAGGS